MKVNIYCNARIEAIITPEMIEKFRPEAKRIAKEIEKNDRKALYGEKGKNEIIGKKIDK